MGDLGRGLGHVWEAVGDVDWFLNISGEVGGGTQHIANVEHQDNAC